MAIIFHYMTEIFHYTSLHALKTIFQEYSEETKFCPDFTTSLHLVFKRLWIFIVDDFFALSTAMSTSWAPVEQINVELFWVLLLQILKAYSMGSMAIMVLTFDA